MNSLQQIPTSVLCLFFLFLTDYGRAQTIVNLNSATGHPGDEVEMTVQLMAVGDITAMQLEIPLNSALTYVEGSASLTSALTTKSHQISASESNGLLKIYVYSLTLETFKAPAGSLLTFRLLLGREPDTYELASSALLSKPDGSAVETIANAGQVTILSPKIQLSVNAIHFGRVPIHSDYSEQLLVTNIGNEPLTVSDVISCQSLFSVTPKNFTLPAGGQQPITVSYSPSLYGSDSDILLVASNAVNGQQRISIDAEPYSVNILSLSDVSGKSDEEATLHICLQNMEPIIAAQCCVALPEGVSYVDGSAQLSGTRANGHLLTALGTDGKVTFYVYSNGNTALHGTEGELFSFKVKLGATGGTYTLLLSDVLLSNADGHDMTSSTGNATLRIAAPRLECASELDFGTVPMEEVATRLFTISNTGEQPLVIDRIDFSNVAFCLASLDNVLSIEAGSSIDLPVNYVPDGEQQLEAIMRLYSNDPENRMQVVQLKARSFPTNCLSLNGATVDSQAGSYCVTVGLQNSLPIVALQFDLHWIEGMSTSLDMITLSSRACGHQVALTQVDDTTCRIFVYSTTNEAILPDEGPLLSIIYNKVSEEVDYQLSTFIADQVIISVLNGTSVESATTASLIVDGLLGDANGDGHISITDVVCIVQYIFERKPSPFYRKLADINHDDTISMSDVIEITNLILQKNN